MKSRCVKAPVQRGEEVRSRLAKHDLVDQELEIEVEDGYIYIPVEGEPPERMDVKVSHRKFQDREREISAEDLLGYQPSYETIGDAALVETDDNKKARREGEALVESSGNIKSVYKIESKVKGEERTRELTHIAGEDDRQVVHREYGNEYVVELGEVYFTPRLANERQRLKEQVERDEKVLDMFAGVGPYTVPIAEKARVTAVDINPNAADLLKTNIGRNDVTENVDVVLGDVSSVVSENAEFDRIVMNLPHSADEFLDTAIKSGTLIHYYSFRHEDDLYGGAVEKIRETAREYGYGVEVLDKVKVRSYAPYEYNICIDFEVLQ